MALEPAIPSHLIQERLYPSKLPAAYQPPFPAYSTRFSSHVKNLVMAILGVQHSSRPSTSPSPGLSKLLTFIQTTSNTHHPRYWQIAAVTDTQGAYNETIIAYWSSRASYQEWASESGFDVWWSNSELEMAGNAWFKEMFFPPVERFETVFSDNRMPEGAANLGESMSGPIKEHVCWGSMRDRLPAAQTDMLKGAALSEKIVIDASVSTKRIRIPGRHNLAIIRSGQDWSNTNANERKLYLETMHPVLVKGMEFLTNEGNEVGCFSNRFMDVLDSNTLVADTDKTFGLGYFDDLGSLENWSKKHKTHLDIFGRFLQYAAELQNEVSLRLFHEVLVLESAQQEFEYIGCHPGTGMMACR